MLGVAMRRQCPDQVASEQARQAYVDNRLAVAPLQEAKRSPAKGSKPGKVYKRVVDAEKLGLSRR